MTQDVENKEDRVTPGEGKIIVHKDYQHPDSEAFIRACDLCTPDPEVEEYDDET